MFSLLFVKVGVKLTCRTFLIGELGDIRRFHSSNALNAYIGIDLRHYESGNFVAADHISKFYLNPFRILQLLVTLILIILMTFIRKEKGNPLSLELRKLPLQRYIAFSERFIIL